MFQVQSTVTGHDSIDHCPDGYRGRLDVVPFEAWHVGYLVLRPEQRSVGVALTPEYAASLEHAGRCFSAWAGSQVVAAVGVLEFWPGRAQVWSLMSESIGQYGGAVHRHVARYLRRYSPDLWRVECVIHPGFLGSVEWAKRLGFVYESTMRRYGIHGDDMDMYVYKGRTLWRK